MEYIGDGFEPNGPVAIYEHNGQFVKIPLDIEESQRVDAAYQRLNLTKPEEEQRLARLDHLRKQVDELAKPSDNIDVALTLILAELKHLRQAEELRAERARRIARM